MKITITQIEIEFPKQNEPVHAPSGIRPRNDNLLTGLFFDLLSEEPAPLQKAWEVDPHGTIFKV